MTRDPSQRKLTPIKKAVFATVALVGFFALAEALLWVVGVETLASRSDSSMGFSGMEKIFEVEGEQYRTRQATREKTFNDQSFRQAKSERGLRLFVLGGSSAYGFPWGARESFSGVMDETLSALLPDREVEVVNVAGVSYAMHRLQLVAQEVIDYAPDALVIYSGHNEFIERSFFEELKKRSASLHRVQHVLGRSRVYSWLEGLKPIAEEQDVEARVETFVRREIGTFTEADKETVVDEFREGLQSIVDMAAERGIEVVVATVPCNLSDWKPMGSLAPSLQTKDERERWSALISSASRFLDSEDFDAALRTIEEALAMEPLHAESHFIKGTAARALEQWDVARDSYLSACDLDASPIRRLSAINDVIRDVGQQGPALFVDIESTWASKSENGLVGFDWIEDYVHPTLEAHQQIALEMMKAMLHAGLVDAPLEDLERVFQECVASRGQDTSGANPTWYFNQGVILRHQGSVDEAIEKFLGAVELNADYVAAHVSLAYLLLDAQRPQEAVFHMNRVLELDPGSHHAGLLQGWLHFLNGRPDEAVGAMAAVVGARPEWHKARIDLSTVLMSAGREREALRHLEALSAEMPDEAGLYFAMGEAYEALGRPRQAIEAIEAGLELDPAEVGALNNIGLIWMSLREWDEAKTVLERVLAEDPSHVEAWNNLGLVAQGRGDVTTAAESFEHAISLREDFAPAHANLGVLHQSAQRLDQALLHLRRAAELDPTNAETRINLGSALFGYGDVDEAVVRLREAIAIRPDHPDAHFNLGVALGSQEKLSEAIFHYRRALSLRPNYHTARFNLAVALHATGVLPEAAREYQQVLRAVPRDGNLHYNYALVLRALGQDSAAEGHFDEALRLAPALKDAIEAQRKN